MIINNTVNEELVERIKHFIDEEGCSCSMDVAGITPEYIQRVWAKNISIEEIEVH